MKLSGLGCCCWPAWPARPGRQLEPGRQRQQPSPRPRSKTSLWLVPVPSATPPCRQASSSTASPAPTRDRSGSRNRRWSRGLVACANPLVRSCSSAPRGAPPVGTWLPTPIPVLLPESRGARRSTARSRQALTWPAAVTGPASPWRGLCREGIRGLSGEAKAEAHPSGERKVHRVFTP
jgi:hypothetical protein